MIYGCALAMTFMAAAWSGDVIDCWADDDAVTDLFIAHERDRYFTTRPADRATFYMQRDHRGMFCSEACAKVLVFAYSTRMSPQGC